MSEAKLLYCTKCDKFYTFAEQHIPEIGSYYKEIDNGASVVPISYNDIDWASRWSLVTEIGGGALVSTVFLRFDHNHSSNGRPVLYETMVFGGTFDGEQIRYCTRAEAEAGHAKTVAMVRSGTQIMMEDLWKD